ncbi:MAG: AMP-binding protein [Anaerovorax sp.]|nr:AMP-binding protein [Anaerovorax sp.]
MSNLNKEQWAMQQIEKIKNSSDSRVRYKNVRPITDIRDMFVSSAKLYADRPAFFVKDEPGEPYRAITYQKAKEDVEALGTALLSMGLSGKRIGVIGENSYQWAITYLATVSGVGVVVPLDKELPENELLHLVQEAEIECIFYDKKYEEMFRRMKQSGQTKLLFLINMKGSEIAEDTFSQKSLLEIGYNLLQTGNRTFLDAEIDAEVMSILLFTSGTTGLSKGVMLSHRNIAADLMSMVTLVRIGKEDVFFSVLPIHHTYECTCGFLCPLFCGAAIAYCEGLKYIVKNLAEAKPTVFLCVPLILENLYSKIWKSAKKKGVDKNLKKILKINHFTKKIKLNLAPLLLKSVTSVFGGRLRLLISGGAPVDPAIIEGIQDFGINCLQGYGLTECGPIAALNPDIKPNSSSAGCMPPGMECKIVDVDDTGIGEICIRGENVMMGYYNNPEASAEVLKEGWFHTGDLGYMDQEGFLHITGRKKNVIITKNGKNVFPEELEYYLNKIPYVEECLISGRMREEDGETVIFAAIKADHEELEEALGIGYEQADAERLLWEKIDELNKQQPIYKRIQRMELRKVEFEKTTARKIKRYAEANR